VTRADRRDKPGCAADQEQPSQDDRDPQPSERRNDDRRKAEEEQDDPLDEVDPPMLVQGLVHPRDQIRAIRQRHVTCSSLSISTDQSMAASG